MRLGGLVIFTGNRVSLGIVGVFAQFFLVVSSSTRH